MDKHTPGPWVFLDGEITTLKKDRKDPTEGARLIATCFSWDDDQTEWNEKLIVAAPEMLTALKNIRKTIRAHLRGDLMAKITHADLGELDDAIAKAVGK